MTKGEFKIKARVKYKSQRTLWQGECILQKSETHGGNWLEPTHEIMALIALHKHNLQTCMRSNTLGLHV